MNKIGMWFKSHKKQCLYFGLAFSLLAGVGTCFTLVTADESIITNAELASYDNGYRNFFTSSIVSGGVAQSAIDSAFSNAGLGSYSYYQSALIYEYNPTYSFTCGVADTTSSNGWCLAWAYGNTSSVTIVKSVSYQKTFFDLGSFNAEGKWFLLIGSNTVKPFINCYWFPNSRVNYDPDALGDSIEDYNLSISLLKNSYFPSLQSLWVSNIGSTNVSVPGSGIGGYSGDLYYQSSSIVYDESSSLASNIESYSVWVSRYLYGIAIVLNNNLRSLYNTAVSYGFNGYFYQNLASINPSAALTLANVRANIESLSDFFASYAPGDSAASEIIANLNSQLNQIKNQLDSYVTQNAQLQTQVDYLNSVIAQKETTINDLQTQLDSASSSKYSFTSLFWGVANTPFAFLNSMLNFEFMGVNVLGLITGLFTAVFAICVVKRFI